MTNNAQLLPLPEVTPETPLAIMHQYTADQMQSYALACIEAAKPADALGSLPVVEGIAADDWIDGAWDDTHGSGLFATSDAIRQFADHAQATAEIARLTADRDHWKQMTHDKYWQQVNTLSAENAALRAKLAWVDGLVEALRAIIDNGPFTANHKELLDAGSAALATYEAAQGKTPPPDQA
jgi:hypothetical protein